MEREIILAVLGFVFFNDKGFLWEILICKKEILLRFY